VAADAELQRVGGFHRGVESAPEEDAGKKPTTRMLINEYLALGRFSMARKPSFPYPSNHPYA
jgi:hypothetical protein